MPKPSPSSVIIDHYLDKDSQISKTDYSLWKNQLEVGLEYGLKRYLEKELDYHRQIEKVKSDLIKTHKIDLTEIFFDLLQFKHLSEQEKGAVKLSDDYDNQFLHISTFKSFLAKVLKKQKPDIQVLRSLFRRLDIDKDGLISLPDYIKGVHPLHTDTKYFIESAKRKYAKLQVRLERKFKFNIR